VLEAHTIAGEGDIHCRVVARDNSHLEQVIQRLVDVRGVVREGRVPPVTFEGVYPPDLRARLLAAEADAR
jgi:hypothetical protein